MNPTKNSGAPDGKTDGRAAPAGAKALAVLAAAACLSASACAAAPPPDGSAGASSSTSPGPSAAAASPAQTPSASPTAASSPSITAYAAAPAATPAPAPSAAAPPPSAASSTLPPPRVLTVEVILTDLENPRGVEVDAQGGLIVAEAGYGEDAEAPILRTGRLTRFMDIDGDGRYGGGETERRLDNMYSFNSVNKYETGRDEVSGPADVLIHEDGRVYLSFDGGIDQSGGHFVLFELDENGTVLREMPQHSNMTGIGFSPGQRSIYATQST